MDYEKKYKEALERAREYWETDNDNTLDIKAKGTMEYLFPELKESEDEKIVDAIRKALESKIEDLGNGVTRTACLAWLEKQGEQKSIDKVEPKFHEGDWVVCGGWTTQIKDVYEYGYSNINQGFIPKMCEGEMRLWTIQDAKDGDVLAEDTCVFIIKKLNHDLTAKVYCCLHDDGDFELGSNLGFDDTSTYPATKEQRDLLFQKMKEEGYEWDANKKELKLLITNGGDFFESENCEQNHDWSEEEIEKAAQEWDSKANFNPFYMTPTGVKQDITTHEESFKAGVNWILKSLKERYTWKPTDEQMEALEQFILEYRDIDDNNRAYPISHIIESLYNDLKKLKGE